MPQKPSAETQLRTARRLLRDATIELATARKQRDEYRARATKAEQEAAEWRKRFDRLLEVRDALRVERAGDGVFLEK